MATPGFTIQTPVINTSRGQPLSTKFLSLNQANPPVAVDVSSGFTVKSAQAAPLSDANIEASPVDLSGVGTFSFSSTGVTWALTAADVDTLQGDLPTLHSQFVLTLTNDAGTTRSTIVNSTLTCNELGGMP